jgi:hypothetical protein
VQWTHPHRPVICEMPRGRAVLTLDKAAPEAQLGRTLKEFALAYGILERVTSHSVRRGAMRDAAYLKKFIAGVSSSVAAVVAAHSKAAENHGLTREYVGPLQVDTYNMRAEHKFQDKLAPKIAASPMFMRRDTPAEIDAYMADNGMDKSDQNKDKQPGAHCKECKSMPGERLKKIKKFRMQHLTRVRSLLPQSQKLEEARRS